MSLRRFRVVVLPLGAAGFALAGMLAVPPGQTRSGTAPKARHVRPLRERFRAEFEKAAVAVDPADSEADADARPGRGQALRDESLGERDAFEAWFYDQRAYPASSIPADAIGRGFSLARSRNDDSDEHEGEVGFWRPLGPSTIPDGQTDASLGGPLSPVSGRVSAIAVDPRDPEVVYVGGAQGGVWKTEHASAARPEVRPLTDHEASLAVGAIAIDPVDPDIIYVGTGEANRSCDSYYGHGILRSVNGGRTWKLLGGGGAPFDNPGPFAGKAIARIIIDPTTAGSRTRTTLWASTTFGFFTSGTSASCDTPTPAGTPFGLWRSRDSGRTWELQNVPTAHRGPHLRPGSRPRSHGPRRALRGRAVERRVEVGERLERQPRLLRPGGGRLPDRVLLHSPAEDQPRHRGTGAPGTLYAAIENGAGSALFGLFKTTDGGTSWSNVDNGANGAAHGVERVLPGRGTRGVVTRTSGPAFPTGSVWVGRRIILNNGFSMTVSGS